MAGFFVLALIMWCFIDIHLPNPVKTRRISAH